MELEIRKLLEDVRRAAERVRTFSSGATPDSFRKDDLLRSAVERQFEIMGEALHRLERLSATTATLIRDYRRIIAFRNILIHGYDIIDVEIVWDAATIKVPALLQEINDLLK